LGCSCSWTRSCGTRDTAPSSLWLDPRPTRCRRSASLPPAFACRATASAGSGGRPSVTRSRPPRAR
jgi:hypothetical protein